MMAYNRQYDKGSFQDYVIDHADELMARHEAGETWREIESGLRGGRYCGAVARILKTMATRKRKQPKPAVVKPKQPRPCKTEYLWDADDFTPYVTKLINPRMRKSFFALLQETYMVKGILPIYQKAYKENMLMELIGIKHLVDLETIEQFMTVYIELVKRASRLEDLHRLILLPRVKKGGNHA